MNECFDLRYIISPTFIVEFNCQSHVFISIKFSQINKKISLKWNSFTNDLKMSPKKSGFTAFIESYRDEEIKEGKTPTSLQKLSVILTPSWNLLNDEDKKKYKILAKEFNTNKKKEDMNNSITTINDDSSCYHNMQKYLFNTFGPISEKELLNKKFILLHINCHTHHGEQYYFPAEIAAIEFNLSTGICDSFHQIIGISKIYPRGFAGGMREYSDNFHQIGCWQNYPDDYKNILLNFITFLKGGSKDNKDFFNEKMELPYMFTVESSVGLNMMMVKHSLERLLKTAFPEIDSKYSSSVFKIGSLERLLLEIQKKLKINLNSQFVLSELSVIDVLESDLYGYGLGCNLHELNEIAYKCSKARVLQWLSNICKYINMYTGLAIIPGKHLAVQLRDGSRAMIVGENERD